MIWHTSNPTKPDELFYSAVEIKKIIILTRLSRYNRNIACGAKHIRQELKSLNIRPLPSLSFIAKVLREEGLTYRETGI